MSNQAFTPLGPEIKIVAATTAPAGTQAVASGSISATAYRVANPEANETIWYCMAGNANAAAAGAVIPTGGGASAKPTLALPAGAVEVVRGLPGAFFSGVTRTAAANLYVVPGEGM